MLGRGDAFGLVGWLCWGTTGGACEGCEGCEGCAWPGGAASDWGGAVGAWEAGAEAPWPTDWPTAPPTLCPTACGAEPELVTGFVTRLPSAEMKALPVVPPAT